MAKNETRNIVNMLVCQEGDKYLRDLMKSDTKKYILMELSMKFSLSGEHRYSLEKLKENIKLNFLRVLKAFRNSKNIIFVNLYHFLTVNFKFDYSKHFKYFLHLQNSKLLTKVKIRLDSLILPINRKYVWKGLSYCKNLEKVDVGFFFQSLGLDIFERKYKIKNLVLGSLELIDILFLKRQSKEIENFTDILNLPEVYNRKAVKLYSSLIFSNLLKQCFKMKDEWSKNIVKNTLKGIPNFNINLFKEN